MRDFLVTHRMVSMLTYVLANIFTSLFTNGYGTIEEEDVENSKETTQDANGTGIGEGTGVQDISDDIPSEEQLIGTNKTNDDKSEQPSKTEKGIEMIEDFNADPEDLSDTEDEDKTDENDENEIEQDEQLDSNMGEVGEKGEVADEKLPDNDKDNDGNNGPDKYEQGPSVNDNSLKDEELRAKEDDSATGNEDDNDGDSKESAENNNSNESGDENDSAGAEDMQVDKDEAYEDFSGINPDEKNEVPEDDNETDEPMDEGELEDVNNDGETEEVNNDDDANLAEEGGEKTTENEETGDGEEVVPENGETDVRVPSDDFSRSAPDLNKPTSQCGQPNDLSDTNDLGISEQENNSGFSEKNEFAPSNNFPDNEPELGVKVPDANSSQISGNGQSKASYESLTRKPELNPCRSIGEALEGWEKRVNVTADAATATADVKTAEDLIDEDASEHVFTGFEDGTAQALGPATAEQTKEGGTGNDDEKDVKNSERKETVSETEIEKQTSDNVPVMHASLNPVHDVTKQAGISDVDIGKQPEEDMDIDVNNDQELNRSSEISKNRPIPSEVVRELSKFTSTDEDEVKINRLVSTETRNDAAALWRSYELSTTRLSQELAEQLRLVLEPTLASKLQGDYKTGKRINMKKVIQYIVSQFRKDKIWMRRTKPNKRDYQVVIAVDDSLSMSEGRCGNFAIEALVTVCRAMSQLEVGNFGVVSFGKQGNIRLLHDFDKHITPEAGIQMISNLTFKQENTILDEPMLELLKYLDNMLDNSVARARLPSGDNPLQQLVLIIADGHFSEKKILKQRVRNLLNKNCMVAFMILDSANESIMGFEEVTLQGKDFKVSKYLDSFPFPYYAVLRNIEALPRTLGDLLRQWFELMQNS